MLASICGSREGVLHIIDAYQSADIYPISVTDADEYQSSAAIGADGTIYVGNENGAFYAFKNDTMKWSFGSIDSGLSMSASAALGNGGIYCGGEDKKLHKLVDNGATVTEAWSYALRNELTSSPVVTSAGKIVCCDDSGYVYSINDDGTLDWDLATGDTVGITSSPAIASDGSIYVGTEGGRLLCIRGNSIAWPYRDQPAGGDLLLAGHRPGRQHLVHRRRRQTLPARRGWHAGRRRADYAYLALLHAAHLRGRRHLRRRRR